MLWLKAWRARRRPHFAAEVNQEVAYLRSAFGAAAYEEAIARLASRMPGSFQWFIIREAVEQLSDDKSR